MKRFLRLFAAYRALADENALLQKYREIALSRSSACASLAAEKAELRAANDALAQKLASAESERDSLAQKLAEAQERQAKVIRPKTATEFRQLVETF